MAFSEINNGGYEIKDLHSYDLQELKKQIENKNDKIDYEKYVKYFSFIVENNELEKISSENINNSNTTVDIMVGGNWKTKKAISKEVKTQENKNIQVHFVNDEQWSNIGYYRFGDNTLVINIASCKEKYEQILNSNIIQNKGTYEEFLVGILVQEIFHQETNGDTGLEPESEVPSIKSIGARYVYSRIPAIFNKMIRERRGKNWKKGNKYDTVRINYMLAIENVCKKNNLYDDYQTLKGSVHNIANELNTKLKGVTDRPTYLKIFCNIAYTKLSFLSEKHLSLIGEEYIQLTKNKN